VQEEKTSRSKMPQYPGLDRWLLVEKMGDGAFSNVYRAKDTTGELGEVAIKVVRKFEMNSNQVGTARVSYFPFFLGYVLIVSFLFPSVFVFLWCVWLHGSSDALHLQGENIANIFLSCSQTTFIPASKRSHGLRRCAFYLLYHASIPSVVATRRPCLFLF
jgi:serine/threonine protein kinase